MVDIVTFFLGDGALALMGECELCRAWLATTRVRNGNEIEAGGHPGRVTALRCVHGSDRSLDEARDMAAVGGKGLKSGMRMLVDRRKMTPANSGVLRPSWAAAARFYG